MTTASLRIPALVVVIALSAPATALAQNAGSKSAALAAELVRLLDAQKLDSFAAHADQSADTYVGALYFPGQLLVVRARYAAPDRMNSLLTQKSYRDVYIDLNSATEPKTKVFIADLGADGLRAKRESNQAFDTADVAGAKIDFDGDWGKAKLTEAEYMKRFQSSDDEYAAMLQALIAALKKPS